MDRLELLCFEGEWRERSYFYGFGKTVYHTEAQGVKSSPSQTARGGASPQMIRVACLQRFETWPVIPCTVGCYRISKVLKELF